MQGIEKVKKYLGLSGPFDKYEILSEISLLNKQITCAIEINDVNALLALISSDSQWRPYSLYLGALFYGIIKDIPFTTMEVLLSNLCNSVQTNPYLKKDFKVDIQNLFVFSLVHSKNVELIKMLIQKGGNPYPATHLPFMDGKYSEIYRKDVNALHLVAAYNYTPGVITAIILEGKKNYTRHFKIGSAFLRVIIASSLLLLYQVFNKYIYAILCVFTLFQISVFYDYVYWGCNILIIIYLLRACRDLVLPFISVIYTNRYSDKWGTGNERTLPLTISVKRRNIVAVNELIKYGANLNKCDVPGKNCLVYAILDDNLPFVKMLIDYGAKINTKTKKFQNPLHYAIEQGNREIIEYLINHGSDVNKMYRDLSAYHCDINIQTPVKQNIKHITMLLEAIAHKDHELEPQKTKKLEKKLKSRIDIMTLLIKHDARAFSWITKRMIRLEASAGKHGRYHYYNTSCHFLYACQSNIVKSGHLELQPLIDHYFEEYKPVQTFKDSLKRN